ncbi:MAG: heme biosynthesis HemY N-terminal domain-containing protein [Hydrogenophaga sp.]|uniref:heme biosynthesis HemY N-terminal domain-containing protein n=1 Tax=Hydrogenophaga sp. TaxID=1904254 RepID=UPI00271B95AF|nr:heme biosynthesis HemY N-terminal domain-containing protein [Hydrogenophaga sp.]MDO9149329.1 heme biosynthesis HemY N-terminal domain-containing protein [Hydrogenophaga sp.]MDO9603003.1 heme biosynthesis HemY N-terminal domain-containing protein [Hydrogenophaga sp.]
MRSVFWLLGLAALAVALALLVGRNPATVTLFWPPYRFDVSFNFVVFALIAAFVLLHLALRAIAVLRELPAQAQRWRSQQVERAVVGSVMDALSHQLSGRFVRAQSAAQHALDQLQTSAVAQWPRRDQLQLLAHLLLAESAQALQNKERRDEHLQAALSPQLLKSAPEAYEGALLRAVRWAVEDRDVDAARSRLAELPQGAARRIQTLRLKLRIARLGGATAEALETARVLAKHRAFSPSIARSVVRGLALDALGQAHDLQQLQAMWLKLDSTERAMPELALAAAQRANGLAAQGDEGADRVAAAALVRAWLEPLWQTFGSLEPAQQRQCVQALEPGLPQLDAAWLARVEQAQRQLPNNPFLQYLSGQACMQRQLWGKAAQLLGQASHSLQEPALLRRTWCALAELAQERGDEVSAQAAWKKAALTN